MTWLNGPFDPNSPLWLGVRVFWWRRASSFAQLILIGVVLTGLMTPQHKIRLYRWLQRRAQNARRVRIPAVLRLRDVAKVWVPFALAVSAIVAFSGVIHANNGMPWPPTAAFILVLILLLLLTAPLATIIIEISFLFTVYRAARRFVPMGLAWALHHRRFDRTVLIANVVLLVAVSVFQIYLS